MKIGPREYNNQETTIIEVYKNHILKLQEEIDEHWNMLTDSLNLPDKIPNPETDHLWDYVMNDFS
jgi:RNAse (barnase) inhibitor barstar